MLDLNKPIIIFYANLLYQGFRVRVADGQLRVGGDMDKLSPAYRDEIMRRKEHLIELLSPPVPDELAPYFGRLISVDESIVASGIAERIDADTRLTPVNGGWLLTMGDGTLRPSIRRGARQAARRKETDKDAAKGQR